MYDVERFGIINTGNPKHADIFLVTGSVNEQNIPVIKQIYEQMPRPKVVVAIGICATSGGIFKECYNIMGGVDTVIPVDVYVPGCAARPEAIIDGVVKGLGVLAEKRANLPAELAEEKRLASENAFTAAGGGAAEAATGGATGVTETAAATDTAGVTETAVAQDAPDGKQTEAGAADARIGDSANTVGAEASGGAADAPGTENSGKEGA
jgi:ech hydrogenase subunit C